MITKFKLFENNKINELPLNLISKLKNGISFIVYKSKNNKGYNNYKQLLVQDINTEYNKEIINRDIKNIETTINLKMSNKDFIESKFIKKEQLNKDIQNSISVIINGQKTYDMDDEDFDIEKFINIIIDEYKTHLKNKKWKFKNGN